MAKLTKECDLLKVEFNEEIVKELLPEWKDARDIKISVLTGGITNKLYRVQSDRGDVAIRIYGERTEMFINRDWEADAIAKMAQEGISPSLVKYLPELKVTIVDFVTGCYTLKNPDFLKEDLHETIMEPVRRIHRSKQALPKIFDPLTEVEKMARILAKDVGAEYEEFEIEGTIKKFHKLYKRCRMPPEKFTVSHNDLLAENFLLVCDGGNRERFPRPLYIIDWEYAGMAPRYYDIGDMFQEILVPREVEKKIVEHYCEGKDFDHTLYMIDLYKPFPDIYWFLWSLIQLNVSSIKFDFYTYGKVKYDNAQKNMAFIQKEYGIPL
jgi:thiamine kinase-like enzyme